VKLGNNPRQAAEGFFWTRSASNGSRLQAPSALRDEARPVLEFESAFLKPLAAFDFRPESHSDVLLERLKHSPTCTHNDFD
jgi:hypothetical protein